MPFPPLIGAAALHARLDDPGLVVLDASWYLPGSGRDASAEFTIAHIRTAQWFDLDRVSDQFTALPHMLPSAAEFEQAVRLLGVDAGSDVVVYDGSGVNLSAARVWWMFRVFGHRRVAVLDGGLGAWREEGLPLEGGPPSPRPRGDTRAVLERSQLRSLDEMRRLVETGAAQIVDARPAGRFVGQDPEPRPGLRGGHMPGAMSLPYAELVDAAGLLLAPAHLRARMTAAGVDPNRPLVATCGSGTSACAILLALEVLGEPAGALYDGSWAEWGAQADVPVIGE